jgi:hypothetical protein
MSFPRNTPTVTIATGASLSSAAFLGDGRLEGVQMPASWTAANLTFQGSLDGSTFQDIYDDAGNEVVVAAAAARLLSINDFKGALWIKVRSGTSGAPVNQAAARVLTLLIQKNPIPG